MEEPSSRKRPGLGDGPEAKVKVAYLGPPGTYGQQAASAFIKRLDRWAEPVPCSGISSIYTEDADYLVIPLSNTLHGAVTETLDCLLDTPQAGPSKTKINHVLTENGHEDGLNSTSSLSQAVIVGELDLPIRHCLVVRKGVKMNQVKWVRSHEQALGQSSKFLSSHLPHAALQPWPSTAGAALSLLGEIDDTGPGAAICSKAVTELYPDNLEVLYEGTQGISNNYTRFLLLSRGGPEHVTPRSPDGISERDTVPTSDFYVLDSPSSLVDLLNRSSTHIQTVRSIHSRPSLPTPPSLHSPTSDFTHVERYPTRVLVELNSSPGDDPIPIGQYIGRSHLRVHLE